MMTARHHAATAAVTTTSVLLPDEPDDPDDCNVRSLCVDAEGTLYFVHSSSRCVYKSHRQLGRYTQAAILAGHLEDFRKKDSDGDADVGSDVRFGLTMGGICLHPLEPGKLLVMDDDAVRSVDVVTGATATLPLPRCTSEPVRFQGCCASGSGPYVWATDRFDRLVRLDMRTLQTERYNGYTTLLGMDAAGSAVCYVAATYVGVTLHVDGSCAPAAEAWQVLGPFPEILGPLTAAVAVDGTAVVADRTRGCLRLIAPDGTSATDLPLGGQEEGSGSGKNDVSGGSSQDGPLGALVKNLWGVVVSPSGDVLVSYSRDVGDGYHDLVLASVPARLPPPAHLSAAPHSAAALNGGLLESGLLADAVIRVVVEGTAGGRRRRGRPADGSAAAVDIPCHRNIMATASPFFRALFVGPMARQCAPAAAGGASSTAGRKRRKAADGGGCTATAADGAALAAPEEPHGAVVMVDDAGVDAVRAVLRYMYTACVDLGGVSAATAQDVLYLAQQWGLDGLLEACQAYVALRLVGPGNAAEWLVCAHLRQYGVIRAAALRAVVGHFLAVEEDGEQLALLKQHPDLLVEAMGAMARSSNK